MAGERDKHADITQREQNAIKEFEQFERKLFHELNKEKLLYCCRCNKNEIATNGVSGNVDPFGARRLQTICRDKCGRRQFNLLLIDQNQTIVEIDEMLPEEVADKIIENRETKIWDAVKKLKEKHQALADEIQKIDAEKKSLMSSKTHANQTEISNFFTTQPKKRTGESAGNGDNEPSVARKKTFKESERTSVNADIEMAEASSHHRVIDEPVIVDMPLRTGHENNAMETGEKELWENDTTKFTQEVVIKKRPSSILEKVQQITNGTNKVNMEILLEMMKEMAVEMEELKKENELLKAGMMAPNTEKRREETEYAVSQRKTPTEDSYARVAISKPMHATENALKKKFRPLPIFTDNKGLAQPGRKPLPKAIAPELSKKYEILTTQIRKPVGNHPFTETRNFLRNELQITRGVTGISYIGKSLTQLLVTSATAYQTKKILEEKGYLLKNFSVYDKTPENITTNSTNKDNIMIRRLAYWAATQIDIDANKTIVALLKPEHRNEARTQIEKLKRKFTIRAMIKEKEERELNLTVEAIWRNKLKARTVPRTSQSSRDDDKYKARLTAAEGGTAQQQVGNVSATTNDLKATAQPATQ